MSEVDYLLFEAPLGYSLFKVNQKPDSTALLLKETTDSIQDSHKFKKHVSLVSFAPFSGAAEALANIQEISEGLCSEGLRSFLEINLPKSSKKQHRIVLGVNEKTLAGSIKGYFPGIDYESSERSPLVAELLRGIRTHFSKLIPDVESDDVARGSLGLGHAYSRSRVKLSITRDDNHILQAIATLDGLDKAINTFSMRMREWYSWTFPELIRIVSDNGIYAKVALFIGDKKRLSGEHLHDLAAQVGDDEGVAEAIIETAKVSMGRDISQTDMETVMAFSERVLSLTEYRRSLHAYLISKMNVVAPNLTALIGEVVGARLISHAGSLTSLAKYPASTVQILGAEKALFRALKTKGNTPKYGLLYHSSFIGRAGTKNKGRISRFLANKCSIASRIDNFSETPNTSFGEVLRKQVEERLEFYSSGAPPTKNADAMKSAMDNLLASIDVADPTAHADVNMVDVAPRAVQKQEKKHRDRADSSDMEDKKKTKRKAKEADEGTDSTEKKKEKKRRKHEGAEADGDIKSKKDKKEKRDKKSKDKKSKKSKPDHDDSD